ncbi:MAG: hypothetical protein P8170_23900 [Gemmatimonadota bacterium]
MGPALENITPAGAWMPEFGFIIASIPAILVLGYHALRRSPRDGEEDEAADTGERPAR